jgi:hypothetical protein
MIKNKANGPVGAVQMDIQELPDALPFYAAHPR